MPACLLMLTMHVLIFNIVFVQRSWYVETFGDCGIHLLIGHGRMSAENGSLIGYLFNIIIINNTQMIFLLDKH